MVRWKVSRTFASPEVLRRSVTEISGYNRCGVCEQDSGETQQAKHAAAQGCDSHKGTFIMGGVL